MIIIKKIDIYASEEHRKSGLSPLLVMGECPKKFNDLQEAGSMLGVILQDFKFTWEIKNAVATMFTELEGEQNGINR